MFKSASIDKLYSHHTYGIGLVWTKTLKLLLSVQTKTLSQGVSADNLESNLSVPSWRSPKVSQYLQADSIDKVKNLLSFETKTKAQLYSQ